MLAGDADDDGVFLTFLSGAEKNGVSFVGVPEVGAENEAILEVVSGGVVAVLNGFSVKFGEEGAEFPPIGFEAASVRGAFEGLGAEGDFPEKSGGGPIEVEVAVESADGLFGAVDAVEAGAGEHGLGGFAIDCGAVFQLLEDFGSAVAEFEVGESGAFWRGGGVGGGRFGGGVVFEDPGLIVRMKFLDGEGDDASVFPEGDDLAVVGDVVGLEALGAGLITPWAGFCEEKREREDGKNDRLYHEGQ